MEMTENLETEIAVLDERRRDLEQLRAWKANAVFRAERAAQIERLLVLAEQSLEHLHDYEDSRQKLDAALEVEGRRMVDALQKLIAARREFERVFGELEPSNQLFLMPSQTARSDEHERRIQAAIREIEIRGAELRAVRFPWIHRYATTPFSDERIYVRPSVKFAELIDALERQLQNDLDGESA